MERSGGGHTSGPRYSSRDALSTRASAAEVDPSEQAATALDRLRFTDEQIASWPTGRLAPPPLSSGSDPSATASQRRVTLARVALAVLGMGVAGAVFGAWLAMRWS